MQASLQTKEIACGGGLRPLIPRFLLESLRCHQWCGGHWALVEVTVMNVLLEN